MANNTSSSYNEQVTAVNFVTGSINLARIVADYAYIDRTIAARVLAEHNPVYSVIPSGWNIPAYISISPTLDGVKVRIDHISDFPASPEFYSSYEEISSLKCDEKSRGFEDFDHTLRDAVYQVDTDTTQTGPVPMLLQSLTDSLSGNVCDDIPVHGQVLLSRMAKNMVLSETGDAHMIDTSETDESENGPRLMLEDGQVREVTESGLAGELLMQLGRDPEQCPKLFAMINRDLQTIIDGDVPYAPPKIPIAWPPTFLELWKEV